MVLPVLRFTDYDNPFGIFNKNVDIKFIEILESQIIQVLGAMTPKSLNRTTKIS
jgi:hypothetical protein